MNFSTKVVKYYDGRQIFETLLEDESIIYLLFALCYELTVSTALKQGTELFEDLKNGKVQEIPDYDVEKVSVLKNYILTGKLKHEMMALAKDGETIGELLYRLFKPFWNHTTEFLNDDIDDKTISLVDLIKKIDTALRRADSKVFENNFFKLMSRYDWTETEEKYQTEKDEHGEITMEWLQEKQEEELSKALQIGIMDNAPKPSTQFMEKLDYPYHKSLLSCDFKDDTEYQKAYAKIMHFFSRKEEMVIPKLNNYGKYISLNLYKFREEQKRTLFEIVRKLDLIHDDMAIIKPELGKYLGIKDDGLGALENTIYYAPYLHIKRMLQEEWFFNLRRSPKYNEQWADAFAEGLMRSNYGWQIANEWCDRRNQIKGYVIGCLKEAGIIKDDASNDFIAREADIMKNTRTFGKYIGKESREQPYAEWIMHHADDFL